MRTVLLLGFVTFSVASMAPVERSRATREIPGADVAGAAAGTLGEAIAVVRNVVSYLPAEPGTPASPSPGHRDGSRVAVGDVLPEGTALFVIPRHESYRYALFQGHRAIVDAASRQIVYIIQ